MASLNSHSKLYDPIRKEWVEATPEEKVRQHVVTFLKEKGYPTSHFTIEKSLSQLPHLEGVSVPQRRIDILVFKVNAEGSLVPFLMVECKAGSLNEEALRQLSGYNTFVKAPYLALANPEGAWVLGYCDRTQTYALCSDFPEYRDL
jgi:hypothetical protein